MFNPVKLKELRFIPEVSNDLVNDRQEIRAYVMLTIFCGVIGALLLTVPVLGNAGLKTTFVFFVVGGCFLVTTPFFIYNTAVQSVKFNRKKHKPLSVQDYKDIYTSDSVQKNQQTVLKFKQMLQSKGRDHNWLYP